MAFVRAELVDELVEWTQERGKNRVFVKTLVDSHPDENYVLTRDFYHRNGFKDIGCF